MADNETDMQNDTINEQQQQQKPSTSQSQSSSLASTTISNKESTDQSSTEIEIRQKGIVGREYLVMLNGKFDFGDRDAIPAYDIILPPLKEDEGKEWTTDELKTLHDCINS
ncbi:hypothetical protein DINM_000557 [Dirofilaria immitis]|nr:hypothetical protein [Dirofilaria immitis]